MIDRPEDEPNEIVAVAKAAKEREAAARSMTERAKTWPLARIGVGVGIGSAAIAAAVLYASRSRDAK